MPVFYSQHIDLILCLLTCLLLLSGVTSLGIAKTRTSLRSLGSWLFVGITLLILAAREWLGIFGISEPGFFSWLPVAAILHTAAAITLLIAANREAPPDSFFGRYLNIVFGIACIIMLGFLLQPYAQYWKLLAENKSLVNVGAFFLSKSAPFLVSIVLLVYTLKNPEKPTRTTITVLVLLCFHCFLIAVSHPPGIPVRPGPGAIAFNRVNTLLFLLRLLTAFAMGIGLWSMYARAVGVNRQIRWWPIVLLMVFLAFASIFSLTSTQNHIRIVRENLIGSAANAAALINPERLRLAAARPGAANDPKVAAGVFGRVRNADFFQGYYNLQYIVDAIAPPTSRAGRPIPVIDIAANPDSGRWNPADNALQDQWPTLTHGLQVHENDRDRLAPFIITAPIHDDDGKQGGVAVVSISGGDLARDIYKYKRGLLMFLPLAFFMLLLLFSALQRAWIASHISSRAEAIRLGALGNDLTGVAITRGVNVADCNQRFLDIMSMSREDAVGSPIQSLAEVLDPDSQSRMNSIMEPDGPTNLPNIEVPVRRRDGGNIVLLVFGRFLAGSEGDQRHIIWEVVDITRQKDMENQVRMSRDLLQMVLDTLPIGVFLKDGSGIYRMVNKAYFEMFKLPPGTQVVGRTASQFMPSAAKEGSQHDQIALDMKGESLVYERRFDIAGEERYFEVSKTAKIEGDRPDQQSIVGSLHDLTSRKEIEQAIDDERHFLIQLINSLPLSMCFIDQDRVIRICDRDFAREAGVEDPAQLVGRPYDEIAPYGSTEIQGDNDAAGKTGFSDVEFELRKNNRRRNFILRRIAMQDTDGHILGTLKAFWDTTDLVAANHAAKKAERAKAAFLANMSHELRTPMNGIIGMADLIIDQESTEPLQRLYAETVIKSAKTLQMVMDEVMDVATLDDAQRVIRLTVAPFPLLSLAEEAAQIVGCIIEAWGARLSFSYDYSLQNIYTGDARHIRQIIVQILTHCSRITRDKRLRLDVVSAGDGLVGFRVSFSRGADVTAEEVEAMFKKPGSQKSASQLTIGMFDDRIGLPLAWRLIDAMHGTLAITQTDGVITCETVLPLTGESGRIPTPESLKDAGIVVASAVPEIADAAAASLDYAGCTVRQAASRDEAVSRLEDIIGDGQHSPLLFLDSAIVPEDELNGFLEKLNNTPHLSKTDILLLLDSRQVQNMQNLSPNIRALTLPPVCPSDIWYKLDGILQARSTTTQKSDKRSSSSRIILRRPSDRLNRTVKIPADVLLVEDNTVNQMVAMGLLKRLGSNPSLAKNGREALDMVTSGQRFDLILMDCMMPVMDGYEATTRIRRHEKNNPNLTRNTIVALTANNVAGDRERCLATGMDGYIPKPITLEILRDAISRLRPDLVTVVDEIS